MSDANEIEEVVSPKRSIGPWVAAIVLALLSNAGWAAFFVVSQSSGTEVDAQTPDAPRQEVSEPGPIMDLSPFVVNLNDSVSARYLRIGISLELSSETDRATIEKNLVPLRDQYIRHLSSLAPSQLMGASDKDDLKAVLMEKTQSVLPKRAVREIYFTEFMMQ